MHVELSHNEARVLFLVCMGAEIDFATYWVELGLLSKKNLIELRKAENGQLLLVGPTDLGRQVEASRETVKHVCKGIRA